MEDEKAVGATIRAARKSTGLTQADVADLAGISERTLRDIESGAGSPSLAAVAKVANVLGLHLKAA